MTQSEKLFVRTGLWTWFFWAISERSQIDCGTYNRGCAWRHR